jgi:YgiT-type zinc finger domain-containing protein
MKCVICRQGETQPGKITVTLERDGATLVFKGVPAEVCQNCGEEYLDEATTACLISLGEESVRQGVQLSVREYSAASCDAIVSR